jgi:HTH-type transcriptional regulator/antitoxin HigA
MPHETDSEYSPDDVSPPGDTLVEVLEARGMSQAELAERTGRPKKTINEIIKGKAMITSETAVQFERVLGVSASFWTTREGRYRTHLAMLDEAKELEKFVTWPGRFPVREMQRLKWLPHVSPGVSLVRELLTFFGIASPSNFDPLYVVAANHFRQSAKLPVDHCALAAWLRRGELDGLDMKCEPFDRQKFVEALDQARALTKEEPEAFVPKLQALGRAAGVAIVFVRDLPKTRTNGATRWLSQDKPLVQLGLRYKRNDILWFTFFHEAAHILLHGKKEVFVEGENREMTEKEREADAFSAEILLPERELRPFKARGDFSGAAIERFAAGTGVHPGIVVGRLHHDQLLHHSAHTDLIMRLRWVDEDA